jgi:hypothetical protein
MPKLSILSSVDPLDGAETVPVVQAGTTKKTVLLTIRTWLASTFATGPSSSTDNAIVRFDSTTGKLLKDSSVTIANTTGEVGSGGLYKTTVSNGSSAVGFILDTQNAFSTAGAKLISFKNSGTEKVSISKDGDLVLLGGLTLVLPSSDPYVAGALYNSSGTVKVSTGIHPPSASLSPSVSPSHSPSVSPSLSQSISPSESPSLSPSISPSISPSEGG